VREADIQEASKSIEFLNDQASKTVVTDLQAVLYELIQSQTETMMLAQVRDEYVFKTIDAAFVPEKKSGPQRAIICILGTSAIFVLTCVLVLGLRLKSHVNRNQ
jgi:pantothenate kinase